MAWVWIASSSDKPVLNGQCHLFATATVNRSASTAELNCTSGVAAPPPLPPPADRPMAVEIGQPELVLDTHGIVAKMNGSLHRVPHRPTKMGSVIKPEHPWEVWYGFYSSVVQISPALFHLYYGCAGPANATVTFLCLAVSTDGVAFNKPLDLGLYAYAGSTDNNIVWSTPYELLPGGGGTNGGHAGTGWSNSVLFDDRLEVPAGQRFKLLYDTDTAPFKPRHLLVATSADGVHWSQLLMQSTRNGSLVDTTNFGDTNTCLLWIRRLKRYVAFGRIDGHSPGAVCQWSTSQTSNAANFRRVGVIIEGGVAAKNNSAAFADRDFSGAPSAVFFSQVGRDPGCVDFYNPAAVDTGGVTFIFPAATLHLAQSGTASFPNPYDSCRTLNDGFLDVRMAFSRMQKDLLR